MGGSTYVLGIDIGTGGAKAILIDQAGHVLGSATTEYPLSAPQPLWSEQNPEDWWRASVTSIWEAIEKGGIRPDQVVAVGLTGQMHGLVLLDAAGEVLRPAILWNDQRTGHECELMHDRLGLERVIAITGKPVMTGFTAPKILWVREHEPEVYARIAHILLPKDYVRFRLTGEHCSDVADASGTSLFDVTTRTWSDKIIDGLEIPRAWLPGVAESPVVSAEVAAESETGLAAGTPVVAGAGDQAAQAIGCGILDPGQVSVTIGTSGVVFAPILDAAIDPTGILHTYCHAIPGQCHVMGVMLSAGGSLRWFRDTFCGEEVDRAAREGVDPYDIILAQADTVAPGSEGLVFLPYLTGERTPHPDPLARGAFVGLTSRHTRAHLARAVVEGISFGLKDSLDLLTGVGVRPQRVRVSGGGANSAMWRGILANVFETEVATVNVADGGALGAGLLALVGARVYETVEAAAGEIVQETSVVAPDGDAARYQQLHAAYQAIYPALRDIFSRLGRHS